MTQAMKTALEERNAARDAYQAWKREAEAARRQIEEQGKQLLDDWNRKKKAVITLEEAQTRAGVPTG